MKVNWTVRFKNKTWLGMFLSLIIGFIFNLLKMFDVAPVITESQVMNIVGQILTLLGLFGVIVDPTTAGIRDSERAMNYKEPWSDKNAVTNAIEDAPDPEEGTVIVDQSESEPEE